MGERQILLAKLEQQWETLRGCQIRDEDSPWRGAFALPDPNYEGMYTQIEAGLQYTVPMYSYPESSLYQSGELLVVIEEQVEYLLRSQYPSGCISLINCNIDSPPDTGFAVHIASFSYHALAAVQAPEALAVSNRLKLFLERTISGLLAGGIHTPNHRWVICGALALLYEIFPDERLRSRADEYLAEGLDINASGEWTERSNAVYNAVCCNFLYHVARVFGYEDLIDRVEENLNMMQYMLHPGGAIATEYSSRHDRGKVFYLSDEYYIAFRLMASHHSNAIFEALAAEALRHTENPGMPLLYRMRFPEKMRSNGERAELPEHYNVLLNEGNEAPISGLMPYVRTSFHSGSPLARYRRGKLSVTLVSGQPEFMFVQVGKARMVGLRWSLGWFGIAGVPMSSLKKCGDYSYEMAITIEGAYYGPIQGANTGRMGQSEFDFTFAGREATNVSRLDMSVRIDLEEHGLRVRLMANNMPKLFAQAVFAFDRAGTVEDSSSGCTRLDEHLYLQAAGHLVYRCGNDVIEIEGGAAEHRYACLRNDEMDPQYWNVACNYVTPMAAEFYIHCGNDDRGASNE